MERLHSQIKTKLNKYRSEKKLKEYVLSTLKSKSTQLSSTGKGLGGIYDPLTHNDSLSGGILVEWPDGNISKSIINYNWIADFDLQINELKKYSYKDDSEKTFIEPPSNSDQSKQYSCKIYDDEYDIQKEFISKLKKTLDWMDELNENSQYSDFQCDATRLSLSNSIGLNLEQKFTSTSIAAALGEFTDFSISGRSFSDLKTLDQSLNRTQSFYVALKKDYDQPTLPSKVILSPEVWEQLLDYFIIDNLQAGNIYYNQSPFTLKHFERNEKIADSKFNLNLEPNKPMTLGAKDFSSRGMMYQNSYSFIKNGHLSQPITSHRYAKLLNINPTAGLSSFKLINFGEIQQEKLLEDSFEKEQSFVYITQLLGLHTQDSGTGNYSLVAPMSLIYKKGKALGKTELMIRGNLFELLKTQTEILKDPLTKRFYITTENIELVNL